MNFHTAMRQAVREVQACHSPAGDAVHTALQLAMHAWRLCDPPHAVTVHWDLFGIGLQAAIASLARPEQPVVILLDEQELPDAEPVRRDAARLAVTVADRLEAGAGDPRAHPDLRWAWAAAAARLRAAADDLTALT